VNPIAEKNPEAELFPEVNGRRATVRENRGDTADGCERGETSKGGASRKEPPPEHEEASASEGEGITKGPRTRRTPGSAAGCNKPAERTAEETVKVVGNHEGGTRPVPWQGQAEARRNQSASPGEPKQEWTTSVWTDGGASLETPREAPGEIQARTKGKRLETRTPSRRWLLRQPPGKRSFSQTPKKVRKNDGEANPPYPAP